MQTMQIMQNVQTMQGIEIMQIMQIMQVMQKRRKLRSKGRAGPYGRPVVGWRCKQPSPTAAPVFPSQSRRAVTLSVTVRLCVLCHLSRTRERLT